MKKSIVVALRLNDSACTSDGKHCDSAAYCDWLPNVTKSATLPAESKLPLKVANGTLDIDGSTKQKNARKTAATMTTASSAAFARENAAFAPAFTLPSPAALSDGFLVLL